VTTFAGGLHGSLQASGFQSEGCHEDRSFVRMHSFQPLTQMLSIPNINDGTLAIGICLKAWYTWLMTCLRGFMLNAFQEVLSISSLKVTVRSTWLQTSST
jgi:hypothetical protein